MTHFKMRMPGKQTLILPMALLGVVLWQLGFFSRFQSGGHSADAVRENSRFVDIEATKPLERSAMSHLWKRIEALGLGRDPEQWVGQIRDSDDAQRMRILMELRDVCYRSPSEFAGPTCEFARLWFHLEPGESLRFLSGLQGIDQVTPVERELTGDWVRKDFDQATAYLERIHSEEHVDPVRQLAMISSVCQSEQSERLAQVIGWVRGLEQKNSPELYKRAALSLVETSEAEHFAEIGKVLDSESSDPYMGGLISIFLGRHAGSLPEEVASFAEKVRDPELRASLAEDLFCKWSSINPDQALAFASDTELAKFADNEGTPAERHDFILARLAANPHVASVEILLELAKRAHDPALRDQIEGYALQRFETAEER